MAKYDFRILVKTVKGREFSYYSSSFFNSDVDTNYALSSSQVWNRITSSVSCSYQNQFKFDDTVSDPYKTTHNFSNNVYLSSSLSGSAESGSINFNYTGKVVDLGGGSADRLLKFKFFGNQVCRTLQLHEDFWYKPERFKIEPGNQDPVNPNSFIKSDVEADSLAVTNHFEIASLAHMNSDLPFRMDGTEFGRFIKFIQMSGSSGNELPRNDLLIGYDNINDRYIMSASNDVTFDLEGINSLSVTHFTSSYQTSSVKQIFTEITSSGNSLFGDNNDDIHRFIGHVQVWTTSDMNKSSFWITSSAGGHDGLIGIRTTTPTKALQVTGDISASGEFLTDSNISASKGAIKDILYVGDHSTSAPQIYFQGQNVGVSSPNDTSTIGYHQNDGNFQIMNTTDYQGATEKGNINIRTYHYDNAIYIDNTKELVYLNWDDKGLAVSSSGDVGVGQNPVGGTKLTVAGNISSSNITASGDISASGKVYSSTFYLNGVAQQNVAGNVTPTFDGMNFDGGAAILFTGDQDITCVGTVDFDLVDDNTSAISFDTTGKSGILEIDTSNNKEQVKMSGGLFISGPITSSNLISSSASGTNVLGGGLEVEGWLTASSGIYIPENQKLYFEDEHAYIYAYSGTATEDLYIGADNDMRLQPDSDFRIEHGTTGYARFFGPERSLRIGDGTVNASAPSTTIEVSGSVSASGDFILGNISSNTYISASQGNIEMSGSGEGNIIVTGSITVTNTGSFSYITASHIDTDSDSLSIGGESLSKDTLTNLKTGRFDNLGQRDIIVDGNFLPKTDNTYALGNKTKRFSRIFLASTIDVSGSQLVISPSASVAAGDDFTVLVSGSIIPADTASNNLGSATAPFHDLYVSTASIKFIDKGSVVDTLDKDSWNNVKRGKFSDVSGTGDLTLSGSLIPSVNASKTQGFFLGSKTARWKGIYLASTIDVSGSKLIIQPSASTAANDPFEVVISGSIIPGNTDSHSIGSIESPFKDLYVQSSSIYFADMSDHNGKSWKQMTKSEKLARTTTFHKDDIDKMKRGESLNDSGHISASGNLHIVGSTKLKGETEIEGETTLKGNTTIEGFTDIRGQFKVNGNQISNLKESLDFSNTLRTKSVISSSAQISSDISGSFTSLSASIATDIGNAGGGNADFSSVGENIVPDGNNTRDLGTSTKEFRNLYIDGVAYIDSLAGTRLTAPIRHVFEQLTKLKSSTLDGTSVEIFEFNISKPATVDLITPAHPGQIVTIINIGSGAITITRSTKGKQTGIYGQSNLTINQHQVYRFICNSNQIWYVL